MPSRSLFSMPAMRSRSASTSSTPCASRPIVRAWLELGELVAGRDHRLARDAVPEVRGAADDIAFDERDLGAERRGDRRRRVPGRSAADDHETHSHAIQARRVACLHSLTDSMVVRTARRSAHRCTSVDRSRPGRSRRGPDTFRTAGAAHFRRSVAGLPVLRRQRSTRPRPRSRGRGPGEPDTPGWRVRVVPNKYPIVGERRRRRARGRRAVARARSVVRRPRRRRGAEVFGGVARPGRAASRGRSRARARVREPRQGRGRVDRAPARAGDRARLRAAVRRRTCSTASRRRGRDLVHDAIDEARARRCVIVDDD